MDFRLLVKQTISSDSSRTSITLEGEQWSLTDSLDIYSDAIPEYACVSYVWGTGRADNPIHSNLLMSDRTLTVLCAAIKNSSFEAFWIDAFCVPSDPVRKGATLESMGYIYSRAARVIAVLAPKSFAAVKKMGPLKKDEKPTKELLDDLEQEMWIKSVWTYQEIVNSAGIFFLGEDTTGGAPLDGSQFLNYLGYYQMKYSEAKGFDAFEMRRLYPNLDTFEDLILDWFRAGYSERSALEVMSNMARRFYDDPKNYFYSMIGALTQKPSKRSHKPSVEALAEVFMAIAEEKGDYSFIFSSSPRDLRPGLEWRPRPELLRPIIHWHADGEKLSGIRDPSGIRLQDIIVMHPAATVGPAARNYICIWSKTPQLEHSADAVFIDKLRALFESLGFSGKGQPILTEHGYAFPQEEAPAQASVELWVAPSVYYTFGAPAMVVAHMGDTVRYIPAVFAGLARDIKERTEVFIPTNAARL